MYKKSVQYKFCDGMSSGSRVVNYFVEHLLSRFAILGDIWQLCCARTWEVIELSPCGLLYWIENFKVYLKHLKPAR